jgi:hypothetical protein
MRQLRILLKWLVPLAFVLVSFKAYCEARVCQQTVPGETSIERKSREASVKRWFLLSNSSFGAAVVAFVVPIVVRSRPQSEKFERGFPIR